MPTTQRERHEAQAAAVVPFANMTDLPEAVLDQIARLSPHLPVVFVLYYGGTIGMTKTKAKFEEATRVVYAPADDAEKLLEPLAVKGLKDKVQVVWVPVYTKAIDSTNGRWVHWVSIGNMIRLLYDKATGFVVCGGTDTMAHMIAAMRFMFPNVGKPIVATGAQVPMVELGDDGTNNLYFAITAAASDLSGPFLMFGDKLMDGMRVHKVQDRRRDAFACPTQYVLGHYDSELRIYPHAPRRNPIITSARLVYRPHFREGVKIVKISPATPSESILHDASDPSCGAMLLVTFGAGNVRDEDVVPGVPSHVDCLWQLYQRRYPVVLGSPMMDGVVDSHYETGTKAVSRDEGKGNAISAGSTTGPLLEVKCMVAMAEAWNNEKGAIDYDKFRASMERDHVGELT